VRRDGPCPCALPHTTNSYRESGVVHRGERTVLHWGSLSGLEARIQPYESGCPPPLARFASHLAVRYAMLMQLATVPASLPRPVHHTRGAIRQCGDMSGKHCLLRNRLVPSPQSSEMLTGDRG
jgi:hypothetical protein